MTEQQCGSPSKEGMSRHKIDLSHTLICDSLIVTLYNIVSRTECNHVCNGPFYGHRFRNFNTC